MKEETVTTVGPTTSFQIGPDPERDIVCVEDLLMKLANIGLVLNAYAQYEAEIEANDGVQTDNNMPPDEWAVIGARQNLVGVSHALTCGCWGWQNAFRH